jgi:hypothetical protein
MVLAATLLLTTSALANGADISVCNSTDQQVRVTVIDQHWEGGSELSWAEKGWYGVDPGGCRGVTTVKLGWAAFAFSVGEGDTFRPFIFKPSKTYNRSGENPPRFSNVCVPETPGGFGRRGLSVDQIGTTCAQGATRMVPVSFKVYADAFTNTRVSVNIDSIPEFADDHEKWADFMKSCLRSDYYGERVEYVCACISVQLSQNFEAAELTYQFPDYWTDAATNALDRSQDFQSCANVRQKDKYLSPTNERLLALGFEEWREPLLIRGVRIDLTGAEGAAVRDDVTKWQSYFEQCKAYDTEAMCACNTYVVVVPM